MSTTKNTKTCGSPTNRADASSTPADLILAKDGAQKIYKATCRYCGRPNVTVKVDGYGYRILPHIPAAQ